MPWCSFVLLSLPTRFAASERRVRISKHLDAYSFRERLNGDSECDEGSVLTFRRSSSWKCLPVKLHHLAQVCEEVFQTVVAEI